MPATSPAQQRLFSLALHNPSKLHKKNKRLKKLPHSTLHEFAATKYAAMKPKLRGTLAGAAMGGW